MWFHSDCVGLNDSALNALGRSDLPWECYKCGLPNFSSTLFDSIIVDDSDDATSPISCSSTSSSYPGSPLAKSSPSKSNKKESFQNLRLLEINFQSIYSKREEFWSLVDAVKPDVIYGCETWLKPSISQGEIFPQDYDVYRCDRKDGYGGVLLGIHNSLINHQLVIKTDAEFVAAKIINGKQSIIVASLYRPTDNNQVYMDELNRTILHLCQNNPGAAIWIAGDLNLPDVDWPSLSIVSHQYRHAISDSFLKVLDKTGLDQLVDFPTRGDNTLDVVVTNRPSLLNKCSGLPALSDHDVIYVDVNVRAYRRKPVRREILLWKRANFDVIRERLQNWSDQFTAQFSVSTPVEALADAIQHELESVIKDCVPTKVSSSRHNQPWFNSNTKRATRRKARAYKKARLTNRDRDWARFKRLKRESQKTCRQAYNKYVYDIVHTDPASRRNKKLGALVKSKRCDQMGVAPLKVGSFVHSDPKRKANILNNQFTSVFSADDGSPVPDLNDSDAHPTMDEILVDLNGVIKLLKNVKPFTASGPDKIPAMLLKESAEEIAPAIQLLFQASISQGRVPLQWKRAHIVPLFKKGSRSEAANYRPISLTSILCKLCEHIIHCAVIRHLSQHNLLSDAQHGFRKNRSCETQLIITLDDLARGLDEKSQTDVILLDYEKAFDKVSHRHLLKKVNHYGIRGNTLRWISDFLNNRSQAVLVDGQMSSETQVTSGVPQGSVLGPLLFLIYINDLPACVSSSTTRLFADDSLIYKRISTPDDSLSLQKDLDALQEWEAKWLMRFNASKCQVLQVTNKRKIIPASYTIHGQILEVVDSAKYLGINIDSRLNFNAHIDSVTKKANSTRAFLSRNIKHCNRKVKEAAYTMFVRPTVEYASSVWDTHTQRNTKKVEQVQRSSARFVMGDFDRTSSVTAMLKDLHWPSLQDRRLQNRLIMLYKIRFGLVDIPWNSYLTQLSSSTRGHQSRFHQPHANSAVYSCSFFPRTIRDWNNLVIDPAKHHSLNAFKSALRDTSL